MPAFRVMQFNMQFGQIWDEAAPDTAPIDLSATVAEIRKHDADILLLQEVEHATSDGTQPPLPPNYCYLRDQLKDYHSHFSMPRADPRELPFGLGLAIFSRTPLTELMRMDLPSPPVPFEFRGEQKTPTDRVLIGASTQIGDRSVRIFNTHLLAFFMLNTSSERHPQQRQLVADLLAKSEGPTFIGGDFNVSCHGSLVRQFEGVGYSAVQTQDITWRRMPFVLDHIFYNSQLSCVNRAVVPTLASDHHVLLADFDFA